MKTSWEMSSACASFLTSRAAVVKTMSWYLRMKAVKSAVGPRPEGSFCTGGSSFMLKTRPGSPKSHNSGKQKSPLFRAGSGAGRRRLSHDVTLFLVLGYIKALTLAVRGGPQADYGLHRKPYDRRRDDRQEKGDSDGQELHSDKEPSEQQILGARQQVEQRPQRGTTKEENEAAHKDEHERTRRAVSDRSD